MSCEVHIGEILVRQVTLLQFYGLSHWRDLVQAEKKTKINISPMIQTEQACSIKSLLCWLYIYNFAEVFNKTSFLTNVCNIVKWPSPRSFNNQNYWPDIMKQFCSFLINGKKFSFV